LIAKYQPATLAAMEGLFHTESGAPIVLIGQPNMEEQKLDNPVYVPNALSFVTYKRWGATVRGLNEFPRERWPDNIPLLYFSYHIMVGLGTIFIAIMVGVPGVALAPQTFCSAFDAVGAHVELPVSLHRKYGRMDYRGSWPTAVARLRTHANRARVFTPGVGGKWSVYASRFHGDVHGSVDPVSVSRLA
jgi:hypothetical protein